MQVVMASILFEIHLENKPGPQPKLTAQPAAASSLPSANVPTRQTSSKPPVVVHASSSNVRPLPGLPDKTLFSYSNGTKGDEAYGHLLDSGDEEEASESDVHRKQNQVHVWRQKVPGYQPKRRTSPHGVPRPSVDPKASFGHHAPSVVPIRRNRASEGHIPPLAAPQPIMISPSYGHDYAWPNGAQQYAMGSPAPIIPAFSEYDHGPPIIPALPHDPYSPTPWPGSFIPRPRTEPVIPGPSPWSGPGFPVFHPQAPGPIIPVFHPQVPGPVIPGGGPYPGPFPPSTAQQVVYIPEDGYPRWDHRSHKAGPVAVHYPLVQDGHPYAIGPELVQAGPEETNDPTPSFFTKLFGKGKRAQDD